MSINNPLPDNFPDHLAEKFRALSPEQQQVFVGKLNEKRRAAQSTAIPLTAGQALLYHLGEMYPDTGGFNSYRGWKITGELDVPRLRQAIDGAVKVHNILRARVATVDGTLVHDFMGSEQPTMNTSSAVDFQSALNKVCSIAGAPFDLQNDVLARFELVNYEQNEWLLLVCVSHILFDGWSAAVFAKTVGSLYADATESPASLASQSFEHYARSVPEVNPEDVADYATLLRATEAINLQGDVSRPHSLTRSGNAVRFTIDPDTSDQLLQTGRAHRCTPYMVLSALVQILLYRYTRQDNFAIASAVANRPHQQFENTVGYFSNMLAFASQASGEISFAQLLECVRDNTLHTMKYGNVPMNAVTKALALAPDPSRPALAQVNLLFENMPERTLNLVGTKTTELSGFGGNHGDVVAFHDGTARNELGFTAALAGGCLEGFIEFNTDIFSAPMIRRMADHLVILARSALADPGKPIDTLTWLSPDESKILVHRWAETEQTPPRIRDLVTLLDDQAKDTPDAIAVLADGASMSFSEVRNTALDIAKRLALRGTGPGDRVGVYIDNTVLTPALLSGILRAGACYVPIDMRDPAERASRIFNDVGVDLVIVQSNADPVGNLLNADSLTIDDLLDEPVVGDIALPTPRPEGEAWIAHTSGSTGEPKGVIATHECAAHYVSAIAKRPGFGPGDAIISSTTLAFDPHVTEIFLPLCTGGQCVIAPNGIGITAGSLLNHIQRFNVTHLQNTPSLIRILIREGWDGKNPELTVFSGGEPPQSQMIELLADTGKLWNFYGPTETTVYATIHPIDGRQPANVIGQPIDGMSAYVLDDAMQPVPVGVPGEIFLGGWGVTSGYLNRPEETASSFIAHPFRDTEKRLYRTGDIGRWLENGDLQLFGRRDAQIKIHGHRIEPAEIDRTLARHAGVTDISTVFDTSGIEPRLVTYYCSDTDISEPLLQHANRELPRHMIPAIVMRIPDIPRNVNGKLDRSQLPEPAMTINAGRARGEKPASDTERRLATLFEKTLKIEGVGRHDSFFEIGGDSVLALSMLDKIAIEYGVDVQLATLAISNSPAQLTAVIENEDSFKNDARLVSLNVSSSALTIHCIHGISLYSNFAKEAEPWIRVTGNFVRDDGFHNQRDVSRRERVALDRAEFKRLVNEYTRTIVESQPHGPYSIGGLSFGGILAVEVARRLLAQNQDVRVLLFDTLAPGQIRHRPGVWLKAQITKRLGIGVKRRDNAIADTDSNPVDVIGDAGPTRETDSEIRRLRYKNAVTNLDLQPIDVDIILVKALDRPISPGWVVPDDYGWSKYTNRPIHIVRVPGGHVTHLEESGAKAVSDGLRPFFN